MASVRELKEIDKRYIRAIAELHKNAFPTFFLTQLGIPFLSTLYMGYLEDFDSGIIISEDESGLVGFIAYSNDYSRFYKKLIKKHLIRFAVCSVGAAIRHPSFIRRLLGAFKKSNEVYRTEKYVELASICVNPQKESNGVGSELIENLKRRVDFNIFEYINLETDAIDNDRVNEFYIKNGFILARTYITSEGRKMNEYKFTPEIDDRN